jgi:hypothetical protein
MTSPARRPSLEVGNGGIGHEGTRDGGVPRGRATSGGGHRRRGEEGAPVARAADAPVGDVRPPHPAGARLDGGLRGPLRGERAAPLAARPREPRPRPQLAGRQPRRHARPPPGLRAAALRLLRRPPGRRTRRPLRPGRPRPVGPHEPPRRGGVPRRVLPAGDRGVPRHLRDRPVQDLVGPLRGHRAPDPARSRQRARPLAAAARPRRGGVARARPPGRGRRDGPHRPRRRRRAGGPGARPGRGLGPRLRAS